MRAVFIYFCTKDEQPYFTSCWILIS